MLSHEEYSALLLSLKVATFCVSISLIPAVLIGILLARCQFFGKSIIETLTFLPLVLPPVVPGYLLLQLFGTHGVMGQWLARLGIEVMFNWKGAVLASMIMGFPLFVQAIRVSVELVDRRLEVAAQLLGASRLNSLITITLPLILPGVVAGAVLCFCRSLGEFGATITFVGNIADETRTLPLALYSLIHQVDADAAINRLIWLSLGLAFCSLWLNQRLLNYAKTRLGRDAHV